MSIVDNAGNHSCATQWRIDGRPLRRRTGQASVIGAKRELLSFVDLTWPHHLRQLPSREGNGTVRHVHLAWIEMRDVFGVGVHLCQLGAVRTVWGDDVRTVLCLMLCRVA